MPNLSTDHRVHRNDVYTVACNNNTSVRAAFAAASCTGLRFDAVPSAPPQNVACAALTGQNIQVTWKPPPSDKVHGVVQGYKLLYEAASVVLEQQAGRETKISHALSTVLHGLSPYTNYTVQVLAYTRAGEGVANSPISCTTEETGKPFPTLYAVYITVVYLPFLPSRKRTGRTIGKVNF